MGIGEGDDKVSQSSSGMPRERRRSMYRQGSLSASSLGGEQVQEVMVPLKDDSGSITGSYRSRKRTPSGKSIVSRTVSVAEYHEELKKDIKKNVTVNLLFQAFIILFGNSFLFGYNIGVLNQPKQLIWDFYNSTYFGRHNEEINPNYATLLWSITNALYFPGGMVGAFLAGFVADRLGRKRSVLLAHIPAFFGAICQFICVYVNSYEVLMVGRFIQGINCGLASQLAPMYLTEITPFNLRGAFGTAHQLFVTIGIFLGSVFGLSPLLGQSHLWQYLLLLNAVPPIVSLVILPFLPESPRYLLIAKNDRVGAEKALMFLRSDKDVQTDIEEMDTEGTGGDQAVGEGEQETFTMMRLLSSRELRIPLIITVVLQIAQQFSGINGIFFYSNGIFEKAGVHPDYIEYAVVGTNFVNVLMTVIAVPIMDMAGRRALLLYPMIIMTVDMAVITVALHFQEKVQWLSYIGILCVLVYVICFAIGLGPIPLMTGAELFRQGPRSKAMSVAGVTNWLCTTIIAVTFEFLQRGLDEYTFVIFTTLMVAFTLFVYLQVPETKNKTFEEIASLFQPGRQIEVEEYVDDEVDWNDPNNFLGTEGGGDGEVFTENAKLMNEGKHGRSASGDSKGAPVEISMKPMGDIPEEKRALTKSEEKLHENV